MYDEYSRRIYQWLTENDVLDILQSIQASLSSLDVTLSHLLQAVLFFGFVFLGFKFIRQRWLTLC